jgi:hypothetical protein
MTEAKDYPPAVVVHVPGCPDITAGEIPIPLRKIAAEYPNGRPGRCLDQGSVAQYGVVEVVEYPRHDYEPSTIKQCEPGVAQTRALCEVCRGTHPDTQARELIVVRHGHLGGRA